MAYIQLRILKYRNQKLNPVLFTHTNYPNKYVFSHWNTERNGTGTTYTNEQIVNLSNDITLYAIWQERQQETIYSNLTITANNVAYDKTYVDVNYSIFRITRYVGTNIEISRQQYSGISRCDNTFSMNGVPGSDTATSLRNVTVYFTHKLSGLTSSTSIILYGYTPIYSFYGKVNPEDGKIKVRYLSGSENAGGIIDSNTRHYTDSQQKVFTITAVPNDNYEFVNWSGDGILSPTAITTTVTAKAINPSTITANFKLKPLLKNVVIGRYINAFNDLKTVITTETAYQKVLKYSLNGQYTNWYGTYVLIPYSKQTTTKIDNYVLNSYTPLSVFSGPYSFTCPKTGIFKINGRFGTEIYGCTCSRTGGFYIYKNNITMNEFRSTIPKKSTVEFNSQFNVNKGDVIQISNTYSTTLNHISIWVEKAEIL